MFPKFSTQSDIYWSLKSDDSGSFEVRSEVEWLVYFIVLGIGFHSKPTKWLPQQYYVVPQVLDSIRYRSVHEIGQFMFVWTVIWNGVVGVLYSSRDWISLKIYQMTPPTILSCSPSFGLNPISIGPWNRPIQVLVNCVLKWSGWCIVYFSGFDFAQNPPNDSSRSITMFPKFWTQSDIDWSTKFDNSVS